MAIRHGIGLLLAVLVTAAPSQAAEYRNAEYGFAVQLPDDLHSCTISSWMPSPDGVPPTHEHGVSVPLVPVKDCDYRDFQPRIFVNGDYNAAFWTDLKEITGYLCHTRDKTEQLGQTPPLPAPGRRPFLTCRVDHENGRIDITVYAVSAKVWGKGFDPEDKNKPAVLYDAGLYTTGDRLDRDLVTFRALLKTMRFFPPG
jgi:hypothetical protein